METKTAVGKRICPKCRAAELHRSQMHGLIERSILRPVGIRAYRCSSCDERFLRFGGGEKMVRSEVDSNGKSGGRGK
jgi:Zn-finger nucleic acid-binding protein